MAKTPRPRTPCWHCKHMISVEARSTLVRCGRPSASPIATFSRGGARGCDDWEREPGIDDDDWDPAGVPLIGRYVVEAQSTARSRSRSVDGWWTEPRRPIRPAASAPAPVVPAAMLLPDPFGGLFDWQDD